VLRIGSKALKNSVMWTVAGLAFVAIYFFKAPFPVIIIAAALIGLYGGKFLAEAISGSQRARRKRGGARNSAQ